MLNSHFKTKDTLSVTVTQTVATPLIQMKTSVIIGLSILLLLWLWFAWMLLSAGGINLKNILILVMSGIIVFVPLVKKYFRKN